MYGRTFEEISKTNRPQKFARTWGEIRHCVNHRKFKLTYLQLLKDHHVTIKTSRTDKARLFLSNGKLIVKYNDNYGFLDSNESFDLPSNMDIEIFGDKFSEFFVFSKNNIKVYIQSSSIKSKSSQGFQLPEGKLSKIGIATFDEREKYWGRIETIFSGEIVGKVLYINQGIQGSLEYHLEKVESYYIHSGELSVGLRFGRAEDKSVILSAGDSFVIESGTMHSRLGMTDCKVIEISNRDNDADSFLVSDGKLINV